MSFIMTNNRERMKSKTIIGLILILLGVASIGTSMYISSEVAQGKGKISRAEKQVNQGQSLFSLNPVSREVGKELTGAANKKISEGKQQVAYYEDVATVTQIGGIALLVIGFGTLLLARKKSK